MLSAGSVLAQAPGVDGVMLHWFSFDVSVSVVGWLVSFIFKLASEIASDLTWAVRSFIVLLCSFMINLREAMSSLSRVTLVPLPEDIASAYEKFVTVFDGELLMFAGTG